MARCYDNLLFPRTNGNYKKYLNELYEIFKTELLHANIKIKGKPLKLREFPPEGLDKEEAFYHLTCRNFTKENNNRFPDFKRAERLRLIKPIIENFLKCESCLLDFDCNGILIWKEPYRKSERIHLYLQEEDFLIVIEKRQNYYLLITSFYVDYDKVDFYLSKYENFKIGVNEV